MATTQNKLTNLRAGFYLLFIRESQLLPPLKSSFSPARSRYTTISFGSSRGDQNPNIGLITSFLPKKLIFFLTKTSIMANLGEPVLGGVWMNSIRRPPKPYLHSASYLPWMLVWRTSMVGRQRTIAISSSNLMIL